MRRHFRLLAAVLALVAAPALTQPKRADVQELKQTYDKHVANKNWGGAQVVGTTIVERYPDSDAGKQIARELPEITRKAKERADADKKVRDDTAKKEQAAKRAAQQKALAGLKKNRDAVEKITFLSAPGIGSGVSNQWALYIGVPDAGRPYLRFKWMYTGDDWLFINKITLNVDGQKLGSIPINYFAVKRDNSGGRVWEWQDEGVQENNLGFFEMLAKSKKTIIRYEGRQYYKDRTLSEAEKKAFLQIIGAYQALKAPR